MPVMCPHPSRFGRRCRLTLWIMGKWWVPAPVVTMVRWRRVKGHRILQPLRCVKPVIYQRRHRGRLWRRVRWIMPRYWVPAPVVTMAALRKVKDLPISLAVMCVSRVTCRRRRHGNRWPPAVLTIRRCWVSVPVVIMAVSLPVSMQVISIRAVCAMLVMPRRHFRAGYRCLPVPWIIIR